MQNDKIYSDILNSLVRTKAEANILLDEIDRLAVSIFKTGDGDFASTLNRGIRAKTAYFIGQLDPSTDREEFLKTLRQKITEIDYLRLVIAFEPTLEIIDKVYTWVHQNIGSNISLDLTIDKTILGGAIIEYKGRIGNFALITDVKKYFS
jgi:hypothetical protein